MSWSFLMSQKVKKVQIAKLLLLHTCVSTCIKNSLAVMLAAKRSAGVAPEVNMRNPLNTLIQTGFETHGRYHQRSKTRVSVIPQKALISFFFYMDKVV